MRQLLRYSLFLEAILLFFLACSKEDYSSHDGTNTAQEEIDVDSIQTDPWWDDTVFYEIFVRSFYDSDGDGIGDLRGVIQKLDYLNDGDPTTTDDLGVTGIWLMPVFPSPSYHGYDVTDYRDINPDYGTIADFRTLVSEAHARGIKIIIDFVGNHTSDQHPWFQASASNSSKRDWYLWNSSQPDYQGPWGQQVWHERNNSYYYGIFWGGMPDLNFKNTAVSNEIKNTIRYWYEDIGVDGFRIDAVKHWIEEGSQQENTASTLSWWRQFFAFQKKLNPALMTVGEAWTSTQNIAPYSDHRLDYCFEFDLAYAIINTVNNRNASGLRNKVNEINSTYEAGQFGSFLTNHDQDRSFSQFGQNTSKAKLAASILLSLPGVPYLYYGEEVGMIGRKPDENIRKPMQWSADSQAGFTTGQSWQAPNLNFTEANVADQLLEDNSLLKHYQKWIGLRTNYPALSTGTYQEINSTISAVYSFLRQHQESNTTLLLVHNTGTERDSFPISLNSSTLSEGTYNLRDLITKNIIGSINVTSNGGFSGTNEVISLMPFTSYALAIEVQ